jgi:hypothetical protein
MPCARTTLLLPFAQEFQYHVVTQMRLRCGRPTVNKCQVFHGIVLCWLLFPEFILPVLENKGFPVSGISFSFVGKVHFLLILSWRGNSCHSLHATGCKRFAQSGGCCDGAVMSHWRRATDLKVSASCPFRALSISCTWDEKWRRPTPSRVLVSHV